MPITFLTCFFLHCACAEDKICFEYSEVVLIFMIKGISSNTLYDMFEKSLLSIYKKVWVYIYIIVFDVIYIGLIYISKLEQNLRNGINIKGSIYIYDDRREVKGIISINQE